METRTSGALKPSLAPALCGMAEAVPFVWNPATLSAEVVPFVLPNLVWQSRLSTPAQRIPDLLAFIES